MRYIRGRDNVVVDETVNPELAKKYRDYNYIKKESDDLFDLVDRVVIAPLKKGQNWRVLYKKYFMNLKMRFVLEHRYKIYGAIFATDGLMYIGRPNTEGGWELICH